MFVDTKETVKKVLDSFFETHVPLDGYDEEFMGLMLDEDDKEILATALTDALWKEKKQ